MTLASKIEAEIKIPPLLVVNASINPRAKSKRPKMNIIIMKPFIYLFNRKNSSGARRHRKFDLAVFDRDIGSFAEPVG